MSDFAIKRLSFRLKDFTRNVWVSVPAGEIWYPRIKQLLNYLQDIDLHSVAHGIRDCTIKLIDSEELSNINVKFSSFGLKAELLRNNELNNGEKTFKNWAVIGTDKNNHAFKSAFQIGDQDKMSLLQGSPECCTEFFHKMVIGEKFLDLTWPMAVNTNSPQKRLEEKKQKNIVEVDPVFQCNIILKCLGIKPVFHSPCSFNCLKTTELADKLISLGDQLGYIRETTWLREILSWPVEWTALHGIAEIKNPVLKISTCTDATAEKYTVRFKGTLYPDETVPGIVFPYRQPDKLLISDSKSFKEGLLNDPSDENSNLG